MVGGGETWSEHSRATATENADSQSRICGAIAKAFYIAGPTSIFMDLRLQGS